MKKEILILTYQDAKNAGVAFRDTKAWTKKQRAFLEKCHAANIQHERRRTGVA